LGLFYAEHVVGQGEVEDVEEAGRFDGAAHVGGTLVGDGVFGAAELAGDFAVLEDGL